MSQISPKPVIAKVVRAWSVPPGMTFSLIEDVERRVWIMEACPVGTHFWTVEQAAELTQGARTGPALQEIVCAARQHIETLSLERMSAMDGVAPTLSAEWVAAQRDRSAGARLSPLRRQKQQAERALA